MANKSWRDHNDQHLNDLNREAAEERMANQTPHKAGFLETALVLLTGKLSK